MTNLELILLILLIVIGIDYFRIRAAYIRHLIRVRFLLDNIEDGTVTRADLTKWKAERNGN